MQKAWKHRGGVPYNGQKIFFDQDYTSDIQKKRKQVRDVMKLLKEKNIKAQSPFPAKPKIQTEANLMTNADLKSILNGDQGTTETTLNCE